MAKKLFAFQEQTALDLARMRQERFGDGERPLPQARTQLPQGVCLAAITPGTGIAAGSGSHIDRTPGPATCTLSYYDPTLNKWLPTTVTAPILNFSARAIPANTLVPVLPIGGRLVVLSDDTNGFAHFQIKAGQTLTAGIGNSATADVIAPTSDPLGFEVGADVTIFNTGDWYAVAGAQGLAAIVTISDGTKQLWVQHVQQPAEVIEATLTADTHTRTSEPLMNTPNDPPTANNVVVRSSYPDNMTPPSPTFSNDARHFGLTGDKILARRKTGGQVYDIIEVRPTFAREVFFRLYDDFPQGLQQTIDQTVAELSVASHGHHGELPANFTLVDVFNKCHNAKAQDHGRASYNAATEQFEILECTHVCTEGIGTLGQAYSGTPQFFDVDLSQGFDGRLPSPATVSVFNRYNWSDIGNNWAIHIKRDPNPATASREWIPVQMWCE